MKEPPATSLKLPITDSPLPWLSQRHEERSGIMVDQEVFDSQLKRDRFPFPSVGDITLAVRNANYTLGPVMLTFAMKPGAVVPAYSKQGMFAAVYVIGCGFSSGASA